MTFNDLHYLVRCGTYIYAFSTSQCSSPSSVLNFKNIMGMLMAVLGMVLYSSAMEAAKQSPLKIVPIMKDVNYTDEDVSLLKGGFGSQDIEGGKENLK